MHSRSGNWALLPAIFFLLNAFPATAETITGIVRQRQGGPLQSMVAAAYDSAGQLEANATTDVNGRYQLTVPAGSFRVLAYDPAGGFATQFSNDAPSFEESPVIEVNGPQPVVIDFALRRGGTVRGVVVTTAPLHPAFTVAAYNLSGTRRGFTSTSGTGSRYSIVLPPGTYKLAAYDDGGAFAASFFRDRQTFADADIVTVTEGTITGADFSVQLGARLAGSVRDAASGAAVPNAVVLAYDAPGLLITFAIAGSDGRFAVTVPPGTYRLVAIDPAYKYAAGYLNAADSFDGSPALQLAGGQNRNDLTFQLEEGGRVAGRVVDVATGAGLRNITVAAYNGNGSLRTFVNTDANGDFVLLLPSGDFRIAAFDVSLAYATQFYPQSKSFDGATAVGATVGQIVTLQPMTLSHGGWLNGTVTDHVSGSRISGAVVAAYDSTGFVVATTSTFSAGTYRILLPPGTYRVIAYDPQLRYAPAFAGGAANFEAISPAAIASDAEVTLNFELNPGTVVAGMVVDESQHPLAGIQVGALDLDQNRLASATTRADGSFQLTIAPGDYKFMAWDPLGHYRTSFMGGASFSTATTITVSRTGAPKLTVILQSPVRRRAARH